MANLKANWCNGYAHHAKDNTEHDVACIHESLKYAVEKW